MARERSLQAVPGRVNAGTLPSILLVAAAIALVGWLLQLQPGWEPAHVLSGLAGYAVLAGIVAVVSVRHPESSDFGLPNQITLFRLGLVCLAGGALWASGIGRGWSLPALVAFALLLDAADGWLARRLDLASAFGARFDMEVDTLLLLILALLVWQLGQTGAWVLLIGLLRYAFVLAGLIRPGLRRPLFPSLRRKAVCGAQGVLLLVCLLPPVPPIVAAGLAGIALCSLAASFALDLAWLLRGTPVLAGRLDCPRPIGIFVTRRDTARPPP